MGNIKKFEDFGSKDPIEEDYEMDLDRGDIEEEHALLVLATAFDMHKLGGKWDLQAAFNKVVDDNGLSTEDDKIQRTMIRDSIKDVLSELTKEAKTIKI